MDLTGLPEPEAEILVQNRELADFFEESAKLAQPKKVANYILGAMSRIANANHLDLKPSHWSMRPNDLAQLVQIVDKGVISAKIANDIFEDLLKSGETPESYIQSHGLAQISDTSAIEQIVDEIIANNPQEAADLQNGKTKLVGFFVGQVMRQTKGKANPALVNDLLKQKLHF